MRAPATEESGRRVIVGRITGAHGVKGWLKVFSHTAPRENIFLYRPWLIAGQPEQDGETDGAWTEIEFTGSRRSGKTLTVKFAGVDDPDRGAGFLNCPIAVYRSRLPEPAAGEYYWADLLRMEVISAAGRRLGRVVDIRETGANDVLVVEGETRCLIPFVRNEVIRRVDADNGVIEVEGQWDQS